MFAYQHDDPIVLSSACPHSSSLLTCVLRLGGQIDPDFLHQCQIADKIFEEKVERLKPTAIDYTCLPTDIAAPGELFLDMAAAEQQQFVDRCHFQRYNSWLTNPRHWNLIYAFNDDLII